MKKRMTSLLLVFVMVAGLCIPASAAETTSETLELIPIEDVDSTPAVTVINDDAAAEEAMQMEAVPSFEDEDYGNSVTYDIRNHVAPQEIHICPIVVNIQTGEAFIINNIKRSQYWSTSAQYESLLLSPSAVKAFETEIASALMNSPDTSSYTWAIVGWNVNAIFYLTAQLPRRVEYAQSFPQSTTQYQSTVLTVANQKVNLNVSGQFYMTSNINPENYYYVGFEGTYYFAYSSGTNAGKEDGIPFACGVAMNSNAAA